MSRVDFEPKRDFEFHFEKRFKMTETDAIGQFNAVAEVSQNRLNVSSSRLYFEGDFGNYRELNMVYGDFDGFLIREATSNFKYQKYLKYLKLKYQKWI